jgi:hypothetical protein
MKIAPICCTAFMIFLRPQSASIFMTSGRSDCVESNTVYYPTKEITTAFWRRVAELTTRTRAKGGRWVGSEEVMKWNAVNMLVCVI